MEKFLESFKKYKYIYIIGISLITTIILINELFDFIHKVVNQPFILILSIMVLLFFIKFSINRRVWENEE